jgi:hypothetical protein
MKRFSQGYYTPRNPEKYLGDVNKIRYMSSWERDFNVFLDNNPNVVAWASEEIAIPYIKPTSTRANKVHRYFPDYFVDYIDKHGNRVKEIIEIKPHAQTKAPARKGKRKQTQVYEQIQWIVNNAKWEAAEKFCSKYGIKFRIISEQHLFL